MRTGQGGRAARPGANRTRRDEILDAALEMFAQRGYRGASIDAVARRVGLTRQGVLHYFPTKEKMLAEVLRLREELNRENLLHDNAGEDLPGQMARVVVHDHAHAQLAKAYSVLLGESVTHGHPAQAYFRDHYAKVHARMVRSFTQRWGDRLPSGLTPRAGATALLALLDGMQQQWLLDPEQSDHPEIVRDVLTVIFGMQNEAPAESAPTEPDQAEPAPAAERKLTRKGTERREQILQAALEVFAERGDRGTSLQEVADRVGIKQPSLLYYFGSREELLLEVLRRRDELGADVARRETDSVAAVTASVRHHLEEPGLAELFVSLSAAATDPAHHAHEFFADRYRRTTASVAEELAVRKHTGAVRQDEPAEDVARLLMAVIDGLQTRRLTDPSLDVPTLMETFVRMFMPDGGAE